MSDLSLSQSYFPLDITTTAGTTKASPLATSVAIPQCLLTEFFVFIPDGHEVQTGIQVVVAGDVIVPFQGATNDQWIVGNDSTLTLPTAFPIGNGLTVRTFNTGKFDHTHYVRFKVDYNAYGGGGQPLLSIVPVA